MPLPKEKNIPLHVLIEEELYKELSLYSQEEGLTKTKVVEKALKCYLEDIPKKNDKTKE